MSELPKWAEGRRIDDRLLCQQLYDALSIAWEALEAYRDTRIGEVGLGGVARDAMRRIDELGK